MNYPQLERLIDVIKSLRDPQSGCPWDLEQDHQSLIPYLIEESFEFKDAAQKKDSEAMEEEIGDVLLQVLLHSQIASETNTFDLESVAKRLADKMILRHPHVFNNPEGKKLTPEEVTTAWAEIKEGEKKQDQKRAIKEKVLFNPALKAAEKIGHKTNELNFDWENAQQVAWKVEEEWQELKEELMPTQINKERVAEELGDFLFSASQLARHLGEDPEELLHKANKKFLRRFSQMEDLLIEEGTSFSQKTQEELDKYWVKVKQKD